MLISKWRSLWIVLLAACGNEDGAGAEGTEADQCLDVPCYLSAPQCLDQTTTQQCVMGPNACYTWEPRSCDPGTTCQDGACMAGCESGCCPECLISTCGAESDDGCGGNCGGASSAAEMCEAVITVVCMHADPCCDEPGALCLWNGMNDCVDHYSRFWNCTGLWCNDAIDTCLRDMEEKYDCGDREYPPACQLLASGEFEVLGAPDVP